MAKALPQTLILPMKRPPSPEEAAPKRYHCESLQKSSVMDFLDRKIAEINTPVDLNPLLQAPFSKHPVSIGLIAALRWGVDRG